MTNYLFAEARTFSRIFLIAARKETIVAPADAPPTCLLALLTGGLATTPSRPATAPSGPPTTASDGATTASRQATDPSRAPTSASRVPTATVATPDVPVGTADVTVASSPAKIVLALVPTLRPMVERAPRNGSSPIAFGAIVGHTEHLAVLGGAIATFAPSRDVIGVHLFKLPDFRFGGVVPQSAERAV